MENRDRGWQQDKLGVMKPVSTGASFKEFLRVSQREGSGVANMAARGRLVDGWQELMIATSIATYKNEAGKYIIDPEHEIFCANMIGGSIGHDGQGRSEALMSQTNIIAPAALSGAQNNDGHRTTRLDRHRKPVDEESE